MMGGIGGAEIEAAMPIPGLNIGGGAEPEMAFELSLSRLLPGSSADSTSGFMTSCFTTSISGGWLESLIMIGWSVELVEGASDDCPVPPWGV